MHCDISHPYFEITTIAKDTSDETSDKDSQILARDTYRPFKRQ